MNHVISDAEICEYTVEVQVKRLDDVLNDCVPTVIKIDVEGWETNVIAGATHVLAQTEPLAILMEFGLGQRYGFNDQALYEQMLSLGFEGVSYRPFEREIMPSHQQTNVRGNILFVNQLDYFQNKVKTAPTYRALDIDI